LKNKRKFLIQTKIFGDQAELVCCRIHALPFLDDGEAVIINEFVDDEKCEMCDEDTQAQEVWAV